MTLLIALVAAIVGATLGAGAMCMFAVRSYDKGFHAARGVHEVW